MNQSLENQLVTLIEADVWMLSILDIVRDLSLADCWIGAGFVRNKVWDVLHNINRTPLNDIDIIYFDRSKATKEQDLEIETQLKSLYPSLNWSVKNQARMHLRNGHTAYATCKEAISYWPETATAIAVQRSATHDIKCLAPYGLEDLFALLVQPTPDFDIAQYQERICTKAWNITWNLLAIKTGDHKNP
ncbi:MULTISPECIES: nucleotidyltransferase family protein [Cellulophaga]|uniref:Nucleotidyltransferase family protein n=1 Tax=Cellulophaga algicola (strain DSM 14237 / IC166 / ACAM 630) TaxID=688270 RepID=E6X9J4_CELAD|nr:MULTISPECIES: nucleotidyltransferase family protein [Cellulophaga]ADV48744.1 protein of unknown function DUF925 [Cellulophaga algicola DSM 14237]